MTEIYGENTPDVSHQATQGWVTMDTATDPTLMPHRLILIKLHVCASVPPSLCGRFPVWLY